MEDTIPTGRAQSTTSHNAREGKPRPAVTLVATAAYAGIAYVGFLAVVLYTVGFLANTGVPHAIDHGRVTESTTLALLVNTSLLALFAVQHSVMARPWFKRRMNRVVPPAAGRSTFLLATELVLALLFWQWRPLDTTVWEVDGSAAVALWALYGLGWVFTVVSTFVLNHFELFGLQQAYMQLRRRDAPSAQLRQPLLYRLVRHPIMLGFIWVFWVIPTMSVGHLLFAGLATAYILVGVRLEERDLRDQLPGYEEYMASTPRFVPRVGSSR